MLEPGSPCQLDEGWAAGMLWSLVALAAGDTDVLGALGRSLTVWATNSFSSIEECETGSTHTSRRSHRVDLGKVYRTGRPLKIFKLMAVVGVGWA